MKTAILIVSLCMMALAGCVHCECPSEDIITIIQTPFGKMPLFIEKGIYSERNRGKMWEAIEIEEEKEGAEI